jgi:hypothetical protein
MGQQNIRKILCGVWKNISHYQIPLVGKNLHIILG